eukprot:2515983-Amphidinium_carterae.1
MLKISMLSGRCSVLAAFGCEGAQTIVGRCCRRLGIHESGIESHVQGAEVVPATCEGLARPLATNA